MISNNDGVRKIKIGNYNLKELASIYCVGTKKMRSMLEKIRHKIGYPLGRTYMVRQVEMIFNLYTPPYSVYMNDLNEDEFEKRMEQRLESPVPHTEKPPRAKLKQVNNAKVKATSKSKKVPVTKANRKPKK